MRKASRVPGQRPAAEAGEAAYGSCQHQRCAKTPNTPLAHARTLRGGAPDGSLALRRSISSSTSDQLPPSTVRAADSASSRACT